MVLYIVIIVVFALFLLLAYRAFGGEPATDDQVDDFLENVREWVRGDAARVDFLRSDRAMNEDDEEAARVVRKKLTGYQQQLNRLLPDPTERDDLSLAIESLNWACRMAESGSCRLNDGVRRSAKELFTYSSSLLAGKKS